MRNALLLFVTTLALSGCTSSVAPTPGLLPPLPATPGAVIDAERLCLPLPEAGELLIWIEHAEKVCRP